MASLVPNLTINADLPDEAELLGAANATRVQVGNPLMCRLVLPHRRQLKRFAQQSSLPEQLTLRREVNRAFFDSG